MTAEQFVSYVEEHSNKAYENYEQFLGKEIGREQARMILPLNLYTEWYWKIDLHNLLHFLALRCDSHAQQEIRVFGDAMLDLITPLVPWTIEAWNDYHPMRGAILLTKLEVEAIINGSIQHASFDDPDPATFRPAPIKTENSREKAEWEAKMQKLGLA